VTKKTGDVLLVTYTYDAMGRRIRKVIVDLGGGNGGLTGDVPAGTTDFLYDGVQCIEERNGSNNAKRQYVWGAYVDELIQQRDISGGDTDYYMLSDLLYRAAELRDDAGTTTEESYDCDAYGNTQIFNTGGSRIYNPLCDFIFTGRRFDPETSNSTTQMYFYRARYYSPTLGRFISRDPIGYDGGMNLYEYVGGMTVDDVDPMGLETPTTLSNQVLPSPGDVKRGQEGSFPYSIPEKSKPPVYGTYKDKLGRTHRKIYSDSKLTPELDKNKSDLGEHPEGISDKSKNPNQNCLGAACGLPNVILWPGVGKNASHTDLGNAYWSVPNGCKRVDCKGISYSQTRCKAPHCLELIHYMWWVPGTKSKPAAPTYDIGFHVVGRYITGSMPKAWTSKQDIGPVYNNITDPQKHVDTVYKKERKAVVDGVNAKRPGYGGRTMCFCCDPRKMKLKPKPKPK